MDGEVGDGIKEAGQGGDKIKVKVKQNGRTWIACKKTKPCKKHHCKKHEKRNRVSMEERKAKVDEWTKVHHIRKTKTKTKDT
jgi:exosome complex RNA-binding protein Rrp4